MNYGDDIVIGISSVGTHSAVYGDDLISKHDAFSSFQSQPRTGWFGTEAEMQIISRASIWKIDV